MPSAAALRLQIESALETRIPGALTPRPRIVRDLASTAVPELDALLEGGLPIGAITELVGPQTSGRTTVAMAALAEMTQAGKTVAWVDTSDTLDPESAAAAGIVLSRQLWVRCGQAPTPPPSVAPQQPPVHTGAALLVEDSRVPATGGGCGSPHPRGEARGMSQAVDAFLHSDAFPLPMSPRLQGTTSRKERTAIGTPSAPNRTLDDPQPLDRTPQDPRPFPRRARDREEQIPTDRQPSRRQVLYGRQQDAAAAPKSLQDAQIANTSAAARNRPEAGHWTNNANNAHGRAFHTPPNAIAAGLPRFREIEARAAGQDHGTEKRPTGWKPSIADLRCAPAALSTPATATAQLTSPAPSTKPQLIAVPNSSTTPKCPHTPSKPAYSLAGERPANLTRAASPVWRALDHALRAADLLLTSGGFSALVLDLGSVPAEFAWRIPLATWFRLRAAADRARTVLLVLTQYPCARSSAELVLRFTPTEPEAATTVLTGARFRVHMDRRRFETHPTATLAHPSAAPTPRAAPAPVPATAGTPHKLHLVSTRKPSQREVAWHRAASWSPFSRHHADPTPMQGESHA